MNTPQAPPMPPPPPPPPPAPDAPAAFNEDDNVEQMKIKKKGTRGGQKIVKNAPGSGTNVPS